MKSLQVLQLSLRILTLIQITPVFAQYLINRDDYFFDDVNNYDNSNYNDLLSTEDLEGRIVGGSRVKPGQAPYQLSLRRKRRHVCGATLVKSPTSNMQIAISAAHCVCKKGTNKQRPAEEYSVRGGNINKYAGQIRNVRKIVRHEKYDGTFFHDIAILFLDGSFDNYQGLQPISLPGPVDKKVETLTVSGWGYSKENGESVTELQIVTVPVVSNEICAKMYEKYYAKQKVITEMCICAGLDEGGKDACMGDSGGPAVASDNNGGIYLAGVVSWGKGCARASTPGVFMRVSRYSNWIRENTLEDEKYSLRMG